MDTQTDKKDSSLTTKIVVITGLLVAVTGLISALTDANLWEWLFPTDKTVIVPPDKDGTGKIGDDTVGLDSPVISKTGPVTWSSGDGITVDGNDIIRSGGYSEYATIASDNFIPPGKEGSIIYKVVDNKQIAAIGICTRKNISGLEDLIVSASYQQALNDKIQVNPLKAGALYGSSHDSMKGNEIKITKFRSGKVKIYRNNQEMHSLDVPTGQKLYLGAAIQTSSGMLRQVKLTGEWSGI